MNLINFYIFSRLTLSLHTYILVLSSIYSSKSSLCGAERGVEGLVLWALNVNVVCCMLIPLKAVEIQNTMSSISHPNCFHIAKRWLGRIGQGKA